MSATDALWNREGVVSSARLRLENEAKVERERETIVTEFAKSIECSLRARMRKCDWQISATAVSDNGGTHQHPTLYSCNTLQNTSDFISTVRDECSVKKMPNGVILLIMNVVETLADDRYFSKFARLFVTAHVFENQNANICTIQTLCATATHKLLFSCKNDADATLQMPVVSQSNVGGSKDISDGAGSEPKGYKRLLRRIKARLSRRRKIAVV